MAKTDEVSIVMKILITGFEPFLENKNNISKEILESFRTSATTLVLPVEFKRSFEILKEEIERVQPEMVLMFGLAVGRTKISLEKVALNWVETKHADNAAHVPKVGLIDPYEELALMTKLLFSEIQSKLPQELTEMSFSAGTYVCNDLYFRTLKYIKSRPELGLQAGFIHLPQPTAKFPKEKITEICRALVKDLSSKTRY